jgi:hypothetical protein
MSNYPEWLMQMLTYLQQNTRAESAREMGERIHEALRDC